MNLTYAAMAPQMHHTHEGGEQRVTSRTVAMSLSKTLAKDRKKKDVLRSIECNWKPGIVSNHVVSISFLMLIFSLSTLKGFMETH